MATRQGAALERKKLLGDPILVTTIVVLIAFLTLFILYPLAILLVDSVYSSESGLTLSVFQQFPIPSVWALPWAFCPLWWDCCLPM